jgi:uncharacterized protein YjbJ (UPF0337 family)
VNEDQVEGRINKVKGKAKKVAGKITGNKSLQVKGAIQNVSGKIQAGYGDLRDDLGKAT